MQSEIIKMCFRTLQTAETLSNESDYFESLFYDADIERKDLLSQVDNLQAEINRLKAEINRLKAEKKSE